MKSAWMRPFPALCVSLCALSALGQGIGDTLYSLDVGGRGYGMGGAFAAVADDVTAAAWNPAGLAYLQRPEFQIVARSMPSYETMQSGSALEPVERTKGSAGAQQASFVGLALPLNGTNAGLSGTLALAFWRGGYFEESIYATRLTSGDPESELEIRPREGQTRLLIDYFSLSYGFRLNESTMLGIGGIYAQPDMDYYLRETIVDPDDPGNPLGTTESVIDATGNGFGGQVGIIGSLAQGKGNWGISFRSEIQVSNFDAAESFLDTIPARLSVGANYLLSQVRRGSAVDFLVGAAQVDHYFGANEGLSDDRGDVTNFGIGMQYTLSVGRNLLPIRVGFHSYEAGNTRFFEDEDIFTFGFGYRPKDGSWSIDLDFGSSSQHSGLDFSLSVGYAFGEE
jgi:long-subunit fatty acid transport protein